MHPTRHPLRDRGLLLAVFFLIGFGLVQVYSSSFIYAVEFYSNGLYFFQRQLLFAGLATLVMLFVPHISWETQKRFGFLLWALAVLGLVLTFVPTFSIKVGGAQRWIRLPFGQRFEPSELLKISYPFILSYFLIHVLNVKSLHLKSQNLRSLRRGVTEFSVKELFFNHKKWGPVFKWLFTLVLFIPFVFLLKQPDFGSTAILMALFMGVFFVAGLKWRFIIMAIVALIPAFYFSVIKVPYRWARIQVFLDPWKDASDSGFQMIQSMLSFYSGGFAGVGPGESQGKLFFLPEAHTDFTLSIFGEEWGFVGFFLVSLIYGYIIFRGLQISINAKDDSGRWVALGITLIFAFTTMINMGVAIGVLPTKGLTLPFLSYGGSSLLSFSLGIAVLLRIDYDSRVMINKNKQTYRQL